MAPALAFDALDDPPVRCGYHPEWKKSARCGNPTTLVVAGELDESRYFLPICVHCAAEVLEYGAAHNAGTAQIYHRYGSWPEDIDLRERGFSNRRLKEI